MGIVGAPRAARTLTVALILATAWPIAVVRGQDRPSQPVRLSIGDALQRADSASESVGIARAAVDAATGRRMQARSGWLPQLSGAASYTRTIKSQFEAL